MASAPQVTGSRPSPCHARPARRRRHLWPVRGLLSNHGIIPPCMHHNRCPPALAYRSFWRYRRASALTPNGMRSMSLKLISPPPIGINLWSKALGETSQQPPPVNLGPVAARGARSRSRNPTRGDPSRICHDAWHVDSVSIPCHPGPPLCCRHRNGSPAGARRAPANGRVGQASPNLTRCWLPGSPLTAVCAHR